MSLSRIIPDVNTANDKTMEVFVTEKVEHNSFGSWYQAPVELSNSVGYIWVTDRALSMTLFWINLQFTQEMGQPIYVIVRNLMFCRNILRIKYNQRIKSRLGPEVYSPSMHAFDGGQVWGTNGMLLDWLLEWSIRIVLRFNVWGQELSSFSLLSVTSYFMHSHDPS